MAQRAACSKIAAEILLRCNDCFKMSVAVPINAT